MTKIELMATGKSMGLTGMRCMTKKEISDAVDKALGDAKSAEETKKTTREPPRFYLDKSVMSKSSDLRDSLESAPKQLKDIVETMKTHEITSKKNALSGGDVVGVGVTSGVIKTKLKHGVLFTYYLKRLEVLGVKRA